LIQTISPLRKSYVPGQLLVYHSSFNQPKSMAHISVLPYELTGRIEMQS
jgi:hypothetical protein